MDTTQNMIEVKNVSMRFNLGIEKGFSLKQWFVDIGHGKKREKKDFWALTDVSFNVKKGEVIGFVGSNGAGKSTLLKIVAGVLKPTKGEVNTYGNICPMIELGAGFDPQLTARENIYLNGAIMGYSKELIESKFQEIVDFSELHDFLEVPVQNFSSGMVARLAFSVATIVEPEILIVDEILSVGDYKDDAYNFFVNQAVRGVASVIEQEMTRKLIYNPAWHIQLNPRSLYNYKLSELVTAGKELVDRAAMRRNEWRDWIGLSPDEGMDELYLLENYLPTNRLGDQKKLKEGGVSDENGDA